MSQSGVRSWSAAHRLALDGLLAIGVGAGIVVWALLGARSSGDQHGLATPAFILLVVAAAALTIRRVWPMAALAVTVAAAGTYLAIGYPTGSIVVAISFVMYVVPQRTSLRGSLVAAGVALGAVLLPYLARGAVGSTAREQVWVAAGLIGMAVLLPAALAAGVRVRRESVVRARAEEISRRVQEERLGIAREVHDVVGHALAVINMQAGVALHISAKRPGQVKDALEAVNQASSEALAELDVTFGIFRDAQDHNTPGWEQISYRPDLGLDQLGALLAAMRWAGLDVDLRVTGDQDKLAAEVEWAAYRIVQESLTNVLRHAGSATATVDVGYKPAELFLEICNDGGSVRDPGAPTAHGGSGIPGMRERAQALGGSLRAGPRTGGGFLVTARLPRGD